jgi:hypothetical protein
MSHADDPLPALPVSKVGRRIALGLLLAVVAAGALFMALKPAKPKQRTPKVHRALATNCGPSARTRERDPSLDGCQSDAECKKGANGHCEKTMVSHAHFENRCVYDGCSTDDDCKQEDQDPLSTRLGPGPCICGQQGKVNTCYGGNCRSDADCGSNGFCSPSHDFACGYEGVPGYFCHTEDDECVDDSDCSTDAGKSPSECRFDPKRERWACNAAECHYF